MIRVAHLKCEYQLNPIGVDCERPRLFWKIETDERNIEQVAYEIIVSLDKVYESTVWKTGKVNGTTSVHIEYNGPECEPTTRYYYKVRVWTKDGRISEWSETHFWETGLMSHDGFTKDFITPNFDTSIGSKTTVSMLRKCFVINKEVKKARLYATALGVYECYMNGGKIGDRLLAPGWTSYKKRLQYQTYDITSHTNIGENVIGVQLGEGWYRCGLSVGRHHAYGADLGFLGQIHIEYDDGDIEIIGTDLTWKSYKSPIQSSDLYDGEVYDARLEEEGWTQVKYNDNHWEKAEILPQSKCNIVAQEGPPVRVIDEIKPTISKSPDGKYLLDFGQNMVGYVKIHVSGNPGDEVLLSHGEVLDSDGNLYTGNLRGAKQQISYILKGSGEESYCPHFTFQGFRYVRIDKYPGTPNVSNFLGQVIHSDMQRIGNFECSDPLINQLQQNVVWGLKGNFVDVPTDCPQRDERLGWTGDAQAFIGTAALNMDVGTFFTKWLRDLAADQGVNGGIPILVPDINASQDQEGYVSSSAAWGDAVTICPWALFKNYGDIRILKELYESMKAWIGYIKEQGEDVYTWETDSHFGDWLALDGDGKHGRTSKGLIATAFYAYSAQIVSKVAMILGHADECKVYNELSNKVKARWREKFITSQNVLKEQTQTAHILALKFQLVEENLQNNLIQDLVKLIEKKGNHLDTGFVGTPYICQVLSEYGRSDIAYKLLGQKEYPSWLYPITKGATTIWEHWDSIKEDGSFWSDDMNSFNHYAYGAIGEWLYTGVCGISGDENEPAYKHSVIKPLVGGELTYAQYSVDTLYGQLKSGWELRDDCVKYTFTIPPNTYSTVELAYNNKQNIIVNDENLKKSSQVRKHEINKGCMKMELGSGTYHVVVGA